ncbi:hypothetical protein NDU88_006422 [Pleurodeles waltl]|uniref:Uncharacterized protein n=1 Tax=Pleurodeles waltl TaxID=8319 RepID=A0AAV7N3Z8_PLEWA|nr:hypothetical protein NDU88_006422 [Pleurodeles waltl]
MSAHGRDCSRNAAGQGAAALQAAPVTEAATSARPGLGPKAGYLSSGPPARSALQRQGGGNPRESGAHPPPQLLPSGRQEARPSGPSANPRQGQHPLPLSTRLLLGSALRPATQPGDSPVRAQRQPRQGQHPLPLSTRLLLGSALRPATQPGAPLLAAILIAGTNVSTSLQFRHSAFLNSEFVRRDQGACRMCRIGAPGQDVTGFFWQMTEGSRALSECDRHLDARSHASCTSF